MKPANKWPNLALGVFIMKHAREHYNEGGWDVVVECWSELEIAQALDGHTTEQEALAFFSKLAATWKDQQEASTQSIF